MCCRCRRQPPLVAWMRSGLESGKKNGMPPWVMEAGSSAPPGSGVSASGAKKGDDCGEDVIEECAREAVRVKLEGKGMSPSLAHPAAAGPGVDCGSKGGEAAPTKGEHGGVGSTADCFGVESSDCAADELKERGESGADVG
uniref:Uncharacterized protein n=1 Tax=Coccolithus braarudii TaxID=221442 RepID=A0A7S0Q137_9EUKA